MRRRFAAILTGPGCAVGCTGTVCEVVGEMSPSEVCATGTGIGAARALIHVPGLAAKPIIDIGLSVLDVDREEDYLPDLIAAGYQLRVREPGHRMVRTPDLGVHVHVCTAGSDWERRQLLFRDWLRYDQSDRAAYNSLKNQLAQEDWPDMNAYAEAKGPLITEITARAEKWATRSGWTV